MILTLAALAAVAESVEPSNGVAIAAITATGVVMAAAVPVVLNLTKLRAENADQHRVKEAADERRYQALVEKVDGVAHSQTEHLAWHAHQVPNVTIVHPVVEKQEVA